MTTKANYLPKRWILPARVFAWLLVIIAIVGYWYKMPNNGVVGLFAASVLIILATIILMDCRFSEASHNETKTKILGD